MVAGTAVQLSENKLLKASEVATLLNLHKDTIYSYSRCGKLPKPVVIGATYRWKRSDILRLIGERPE